MTSKSLRSMYNKTIFRFGFCDLQNNQGLGKPSSSADNSHLDLDYSGYQKKPIVIIVHYFTGNNFGTLITGRLIYNGRPLNRWTQLHRSSTVHIIHNVEIEIREKSDFTIIIVGNEMQKEQ